MLARVPRASVARAGGVVKLRFFPSSATAHVASYPGLELLAAAVLMLRTDERVTYVNPAAENLFELSRQKFLGHTPRELFGDCPALAGAIAKAVAERRVVHRAGDRARRHRARASCTSRAPCRRSKRGDATLLVEFRHIDQQLKIAREERLLEQQQANRELIRSLAHEIKNPLGGIRGAAQLLEARARPRPQLTEYTQVIIGEADRLQSLVNRLLTPSRLPTYRRTNIHEILVRVKSVVQAEFPAIRDAAATSTSASRSSTPTPSSSRRPCSTS